MAAETRDNQVEQRIVLPIFLTGGLRDMQQLYVDTMTKIENFGRLDPFISLTCNFKCQEIQENLFQSQSTQDLFDLVSIELQTKLHDVKDHLLKKEICGKVPAQVYVTEFYKKGLPQAHMLVILKPDYNTNTLDQTYKFVCAGLTDKDRYPHLYDWLSEHIMPGACGALKRSNSCMVNTKYKYEYPKPYYGKKISIQDRYSIYRKSYHKQRMLVRGPMLDDTWVVPYNSDFLGRFNCYMSVEICSYIKSAEYLYKYIYKAQDRIYHFQNTRRVPTQEAIWRSFDFKDNALSPAASNFQVHAEVLNVKELSFESEGLDVPSNFLV